MPVPVPNPLTVKAPYNDPEVPMPTLPVPVNILKDLFEVVEIDGVVPVKLNAELLEDNASVENVGVPLVVMS